MNKSSQPASRSHGQMAAEAAAAVANLPFSIDHILSSSAPMKTSIDQHLHQQQQHHQQQAAAMMMLNQSFAAAVAAAANNSNNAQDMGPTAMLNDQLALLAASNNQHQHQHRHQHQHQHPHPQHPSHLINPTALAAAAAAQQHLQWQHQQQQLMAAAAAAAAVSQQQQLPPPPPPPPPPHQPAGLTPLSALNSLAAVQQQQPNGLNGAPQNLLSCFMASLMLQQQQQQKHQTLLDQRHPFAASLQMAANQSASRSSSSSSTSMNNNNNNNNNGPSAIKQFLGDPMLGPGAGLASSSPSESISQFMAAFSANKPAGGQCSPPSSISNLNRFGAPSTNQHHHNRDSSFKNSSSLSPRSPPSPRSISHSNRGSNGVVNEATCNGQQHQRRPSRCDNDRPQKGPSSTTSDQNHHRPGPPSANKQTTLTSSSVPLNESSSAALSSLSNFVSNSLAPILDNDHHLMALNRNRSSSGGKPSSLSGSSASGTPNLSVSSSLHQQQGKSKQLNNSQSLESNEHHHHHHHLHRSSSPQAPQSPTGSILGAVASALKGSPTSAATTINTTLAKAPPELVQKQPAWVFCTRYSDRPSSGPRTRRAKSKDKKPKDPKLTSDEKRPRTAFTSEQLEKLRREFQANSYLDEKRRKDLAERLCLNENQIKIWFQNKRAKIKKQSNQPNPLRGLLVAGGLYNHSTATSDCSESYANGLDQDVGDQVIDDIDGDQGGHGGNNNNNNNDDHHHDAYQHQGDSSRALNDSRAKRKRGWPEDDADDDDDHDEEGASEDDQANDRGDFGLLRGGGGSNFNNNNGNGNANKATTQSSGGFNKRARLTQNSEDGSDVSNDAINDLEEDDERVISVS